MTHGCSTRFRNSCVSCTQQRISRQSDGVVADGVFSMSPDGSRRRELLEVLHRSDPASRCSVVVPAWFGVADRHHVAAYLDPEQSKQLTLVSSPLAARVRPSPRQDRMNPRCTRCCASTCGAGGLLGWFASNRPGSRRSPAGALRRRPDRSNKRPGLQRWLVDHCWLWRPLCQVPRRFLQCS